MIRRRDVLKAGAALAATAGLPRAPASADEPAFDPKPDGWRTFELVTRIEIASPTGASRAWLPVPSYDDPDWMRPAPSTWTTNGTADLHKDPRHGATMLAVEWPAGTAAPTVELRSRVATRNRAADLQVQRSVPPLDAAERAHLLAATELLPTDGIVKQTADQITRDARSDMEKARAIYEWIVENTFRDAKTRGCGTGDIASLLKSGNLGGKCADLNALFVGLARASGLPARDLYGLRVAPSRFGYKSLGAASEVVTKAQHCRAEVWLAGFGWVPVDPADVRKVALEEPPGNLPLGDPKVRRARRTLFGAWETNWIAYNSGADLPLPGAQGGPVAFLMYPQAETGGKRLDELDPDAFRYTITAREITA